MITLRTQAYTWSCIQIASQRSPLSSIFKRHLCWKRKQFEWTSFQNVWRYHIQLKSLSFEIFMRRNSCKDSFCTLSPESSTESDSQSYEQSQKSFGQKYLWLRKSGVNKDMYEKLNLGRYIPVELRDFQSRSAFSFCRHLSIYSSAGKKDFPPKEQRWTRFSVI